MLSLPLREYSQRAWKSDFYDFIKNAPLPLFGKGAYAPSLIFGKGADAPSPIGRGHYHMVANIDAMGKYLKCRGRIIR